MVPTKIFLSLEDARLLLKHLPSPLELSGDHPRGKHASTSICTPERHTTQFRKGFLGFMQSYKVAWFFRRFHSCLRVFCAKYRKENTPPEPIFFFLLHLIQMTKSCIRQLQKIDESIFKNASIPPPYTRTCVNVCARAQTHVCFLTRVISNSHWSSYLENVESAWDFFFFTFWETLSKRWEEAQKIPIQRGNARPLQIAQNHAWTRDVGHAILRHLVRITCIKFFFDLGSSFKPSLLSAPSFRRPGSPSIMNEHPAYFGISMGLCRSSRLWQMPHPWFWVFRPKSKRSINIHLSWIKLYQYAQSGLFPLPQSVTKREANS